MTTFRSALAGMVLWAAIVIGAYVVTTPGVQIIPALIGGLLCGASFTLAAQR